MKVRAKVAVAPLLLAGVAALAGCGHAATVGFRPDGGAAGAPAVAEAEGVRLTARAEPWRGWPDDLQERLTPIRIRLENRGARVLRVGYENLQLQTDTGLRYIALPPETVSRLLGLGARQPFVVGVPAAPPGMLGPPEVVPPPSPPVVSGTVLLDTGLQPGDALEGVVFFRAAAVRVLRMALTTELVEDRTGNRLASLTLAFARAPGPAVSAATPPLPAEAPPPAR
ncbi:MAG TPA: hypothetical protein VFE30_15060 [Anaeromyxobacteraceae bacterium]|nr:hypothetical protein [Anaeromyxobacteraceae bacterium]